MFLTLLNDTSEAQTGTVTADLKALGLKKPGSARELVSGNVANLSGIGWRVSLRPQQAEVLGLDLNSLPVSGESRKSAPGRLVPPSAGK